MENYLSCSKCGKAIAPYKNNLKRHESKCMGAVDKRCISCPECKQVFSGNELLRNHVEKDHHVNLEKEELYFSTYSDFLRIEKQLRFQSKKNRHSSSSKTLACSSQNKREIIKKAFQANTIENGHEIICVHTESDHIY